VLPHSHRNLPVRHDVNFDVGHPVDAEHVVRVEVPLSDLSTLELDLAVKGGRQVVNDAAFHLASTVSGLITVPQSTAQTTGAKRIGG